MVLSCYQITIDETDLTTATFGISEYLFRFASRMIKSSSILNGGRHLRQLVSIGQSNKYALHYRYDINEYHQAPCGYVGTVETRFDHLPFFVYISKCVSLNNLLFNCSENH
ncbi:hypothetical protein BLOT_009307 [Blomia tropicalis]|nr:hypothetical protein BLOT_009307 [Blomia tropicalis]